MIALGVAGAPRRGDPPLASVFERTQTVVRSAWLEHHAAPGGMVRYAARIEVAWPPGGPGSAALRGQVPGTPAGALEPAQALLARHPPGRVVQVRVAEGQPWVDATDAAALATSALMVALGAAVTAAGALLNRALR